ncbi:MAG: OmpA family protein [Paracoccaceae bacterium]|nr:OmpA family protein [Paracoccaceae bacterium]
MAEREPPPPRRIFVAGLLAALLAGGTTALVSFGAVTAPDTETFRFSRGTVLAAGEEARLRGALAAAVADDRITVTVTGHSGTLGEAAANLALSEDRAERVRTIALDMGLAADRITASGVGGGAPLPREAGQSERAHEASLARVEVTLQRRR